MGISVFAPGFSGSLIAIAMGIYHDLVEILANPLRDMRRNVRFLAPFLIGAGISAVLFVLAFRFLFETYIQATYFLFVGLIAGNLPLILQDLRRHKPRRQHALGGIVTFTIAVALMLLSPLPNGGAAAGAAVIQSGYLFFALGGILAGATALIPGMSISAVLIMMGIYPQLIIAAESLLRLDFTYLPQMLLFLLFVLAGVVLISRGIKSLFKKIPALAYTAVFGFVAGSLVGILIQSFRLYDPNFTWPLGIIMLAAGLGISALFFFLSKSMGKFTVLDSANL